MSNLHTVLESCLQEVQMGTEIESVLERYPGLVEELRPMIQASLAAQQMASSGPSAEVLRRNRAKLLQHAAQLREEERKAFLVRPALQPWVMALAVLVLFFFGGTSLVRASAAALPGDGLYPVKRSWEDFTLALTFDSNERELLEVEYENERLEELQELFASGRTAYVEFTGIVSRENGEGWWISNILVVVPDELVLPGPPVQVGAAVRVSGITTGNGIVLAEVIETLPAGAALPEVEEQDQQPEVEVEEPEATVRPTVDHSGPGSENEAPEIEASERPSVIVTPKTESIAGTLTSIHQDLWQIDNVGVDVGNAEIKGSPVLGAQARAEGYFGTDGRFVAVKIEIFNPVLDNKNNNSNTTGADDASNATNEHGNQHDHDSEADDNHEDDNDNDPPEQQDENEENDNLD